MATLCRATAAPRQVRAPLLCSAIAHLDPWCSGPTCQPVTLEIAGSNPVGSAINRIFLRPVRPPGRGVPLVRGTLADPYETTMFAFIVLWIVQW